MFGRYLRDAGVGGLKPDRQAVPPEDRVSAGVSNHKPAWRERGNNAFKAGHLDWRLLSPMWINPMWLLLVLSVVLVVVLDHRNHHQDHRKQPPLRGRNNIA